MCMVELFEARFNLVWYHYNNNKETLDSALFALKMIRRLARDMRNNGFLTGEQYMDILKSMISMKEKIEQEQEERDKQEYLDMIECLD